MLENLDLSEALAAATISICTVEILGELEEADIAAATAITTTPAQVILEASSDPDPKDLKKLRSKHHSVARMIAGGMQQTMVANLTGYTQGYLSTLLESPSMQELVTLYRAQTGAQLEVIVERYRRIGDAALDELETRLENAEARAGMDVHELLSIAKTGGDRSGTGPQHKHHVVNENHIIDHAELRRRDQAAREGSSSRIIPIAALPAPEADNGEDA